MAVRASDDQFTVTTVSHGVSVMGWRFLRGPLNLDPGDVENLDEVRLRSGMDVYLRSVAVMDRLPKTATRKILKREVKGMR